MFRHSRIAAAVLGLSLSGSLLWADGQDQRQKDRSDQQSRNSQKQTGENSQDQHGQNRQSQNREDRQDQDGRSNQDQNREDHQDQNRDHQQTHRQLRNFLGVAVGMAPQVGAGQQEGVTVVSVSPNSPAAQAGLRQGDVITQVGRRTVEDFRDLSNAINRVRPGEQVNLHVQRNGQQMKLQVKLAAIQGGQIQEADAQDQDQGQQRQRQHYRDRQDRDPQGYAQQWRGQQNRDQQGDGRQWQDQQARQGRGWGDSSGNGQALQRLQQRFEELENRFEEIAQQSRGQGQQRRYGRLQEDSGSQSRSLQRLQQRVEELEEQLQQAQQNQSEGGRQGGQLGIQAARQSGQEGHGLRVTDLEDDSPAAQAGLRRGDVILRVDGRRVASNQDLRQAMQQAEPGQEVTVEIVRNGRQRELDLRTPRGSHTQGREYQRLQQRVERLERQIREREED